MKARYTSALTSLFFCLFLLGFLGATDVYAQFPECTTPELGVAGPEVCVSIRQAGGGAPTTFRGPAPVGSPGFPVIATVGDYAVNLIATYSFGDAGMAVDITGTITKMSAGSGALIIQALGGWGTPLDFSDIYCFSGAPTGVPCADILLDGTSTGVATVEASAQVGFPTGFASGPAEGLTWTPFLRTCPVTLYGAETFECNLYDQLLPNQLPPPFPQVAVGNTTVVDILDVGTVVDLPSRTNSGVPPTRGDGPEINGQASVMVNPDGSWETTNSSASLRSLSKRNWYPAGSAGSASTSGSCGGEGSGLSAHAPKRTRAAGSANALALTVHGIRLTPSSSASAS